MRGFHPLTIRDVRRETEDAVSIAFDLPAELAEDFRFHQGQFLTLRTEMDGQEVRRSYSICSGLDDGELRVAIRKVPGGRFSSFANDVLKPGDVLEAMAPDGRFFTELDPESARHYVLIAAGSGITPMLSIARSVLAREPKSRVSLIYGNRNVASILFRQALQDLKDRYLDRVSLYHVLSREPQDSALMTGRIDAQKMQGLLDRILPPDTVDEWFICGPLPMIDAVRDTLQAAGVDRHHIHFELFTDGFGRPLGSQTAPIAEAIPSDTPMAAITLLLDGIESRFDAPMAGPSLLDAALKERPDLPFACKGGVCCTCRAKVLEGEVSMTVNYGLEPDEIDKGFVLTCQAHPKTDKVTLDFDAR